MVFIKKMTDAMTENLRTAVTDLLRGIKCLDLAATLGWQDVKQRYRRSALGPFWLTISMAVLIGTLAMVFGGVFNAKMDEFLPFLAIGFVLWAYISTVINEGCTAFSNSDAIIKQLPLPMTLHVFRVVWRNQIIMAHNAVIVPLVFLAFLKLPGLIVFEAVLGLLLNTLILAWIALLLGIICTRYRDLPQIVNSLLQIAFYTTPIVWMPNLLAGTKRGFLLIQMNPLFHMIEVIRAPLLGHSPSMLSWLVVVNIAFWGWLLTLLFFGKYRNRISYWL